MWSKQFYETDPSRDFVRGYTLQFNRGTGPVNEAITSMIAGRLDRTITIGNELLDFAERTNNQETHIVADRILGGGYALIGDLLSAEKHLSRILGTSQLTSPLRGDTFPKNRDPKPMPDSPGGRLCRMQGRVFGAQSVDRQTELRH